MSRDASRYTCLMRKISGNLFMAIDGVVESPEKWSLSYWNDDIANVVMGGMRARTRCCSAGSVRAIRRGLARPYGRGRSRCGLHEQREEVRGVTHLDQPVPGLMGTPTEVPLVVDRSTRALTFGYGTEIR